MRRHTMNLVESREEAKKLRESFFDAPASKHERVPWTWPDALQEVGTCEAVMYASNKWKADPSDIEDYKHRAEAKQWLLCAPGFLREANDPRRKLTVTGPMVEVNRPMPDSFAVLAKILGVQARLYAPGTEQEPYQLPNGDDGLVQIDMAGASLGAARHPETHETFLVVYSGAGVHCIIVGEELDVLKDGIVG